MKIFAITFVSILALFVIQTAATPQWRSGKDGTLFLLENENKYNWLQASNECARRGLQLVTIDGAKKNAEVIDVLKAVYGYSPNVWIGATDEYQPGVSRPFYWSSSGKKVEFTYWKAGEPNNLVGLEHCVYIWLGVECQWNDAPCDTTHVGYICEIRK